MEEGEAQKTSAYGKRPLWHWILLYVVVAVVVYGLFYYFVLAKKGGTPYNQTGSYQQTVTPTSVPTVVPTSAMNSAKITIGGSEYAFTPSKVTLKKGETTTITFKNTGKYPHNLTIAGLNVKSKTIQPGQQDTFSVTPSKTGSFSFMCTVPGHADKGMTGTLTVQ